MPINEVIEEITALQPDLVPEDIKLPTGEQLEAGQVTVTFADGQDRAQSSAKAGSFIDRDAATLPEDIRERITRKRRAGDADPPPA